jgi:hypothetical protein
MPELIEVDPAELRQLQRCQQAWIAFAAHPCWDLMRDVDDGAWSVWSGPRHLATNRNIAEAVLAAYHVTMAPALSCSRPESTGSTSLFPR